MPDAILSVLAAAAPSTTSILLASMGGLINRQGGIVNIGLEPMMLVGAFAAVIVSAQTGNPFLGLLAATASGALLGLVFSWSITRLGANEIVAGLGLNLLVLGFFGYLLPTVFKIEGTYLPPGLVGLPRVDIPLVAQIPGLGPIVSGHDVVTYLSWLSVPLVSIFLYRTPLGIQLRATGANEESARAAGVPRPPRCGPRWCASGSPCAHQSPPSPRLAPGRCQPVVLRHRRSLPLSRCARQPRSSAPVAGGGARREAADRARARSPPQGSARLRAAQAPRTQLSR